MAAEIASLFATIGADVSGFKQGMTTANTSLDTFSSKMATLGGGLMKGGAKLTAGVSVPIVGMAAMAGKAAISVESAFAGVVKTTDGLSTATGALTTEGQALKQEFRDLASDVPIVVEELMGIGELGGQLGVGREDLIAFTETIAAMGVATNLTTEAAATQFAQLGNIMDTTEFDRMGSAIVALGNDSATTEADISAFASRISGAGKIAGLSTADVFGIGAAFSSVGIQAEAGGTAVQKVLMDMNAAVMEGGDQLGIYAQAAGMTADEFAEKFQTDAAGAFTDFVTGLGTAGDDAMGILDDLEMTDQRLTRAFLSLGNAGDLLGDSVATSNEAWNENSALTKEAGQRYATTESQLGIALNTVKDLASTLGETLIPVLKSFLDATMPFVKGLAEGFKNLDPEAQKLIIAIPLIVAAIGPLVLGIGALVTVVGLLTGPAGAVILVVAAIAGLVALFVKKEGGLEPAIATVKAAFADFTVTLDTIKTKFTEFKTAVAGIPDAVSGIATAITTGITGKADTVATDIETFIADNIVGPFEKMDLKGKGEALITGVKGVLAGIKAKAAPALADMASWYDTNIKAPFAAGDLLTVGKNIITGVKGVLTGVMNAQIAVATKIATMVTELIQPFKDIDLKQIGKDVIAGLKAGLDEKWEEVKGGIGGIADKITSPFKKKGKSPWPEMIEHGKDAMGGFGIGVREGWDPVQSSIGGMADALLLISREFLRMAGSLDAGRLKKIGNAFKNMGKGIDEVVSAMARMQAMGAMGGGDAGGGLGLGGIAAMWDQFEQVAHFVMGKIASVVDAMGGTKWGARRIKELRKTAARLRDIIDFVMVDLSNIKVHNLDNISVWGEQLYGVTITILSVLQRLNEAFGERALKVAKDIAVNIGGVLGLLDQSLEFEINTSPTFVEDIKTFVAQIKTIATGDDGLGGLVGWLGYLGNAARQAIKDAAAAATDVKALVDLLGMSLKIEDVQEGWALALPQWLGRMEIAVNLLVPMLDRLHVAWGQAEEGAKSLLEQGSITAGHVAGVLSLMSQKLEVEAPKEGFLGALQTHLNHVGAALMQIVPTLEWIRAHFVSELDPEVNRLDEVQGIAAKVTDVLGVMGAGLEAKVPGEGFLDNLQGYLNHVGAALMRIVPTLEWIHAHFTSKVDPAVNRLDEVQGVAGKVTSLLGVLGQSLKFELPDAGDFGGQLDKFLAFMELAADKTVGMVKRLRERWDPNATADNTVLGQLAQASQDVQSVLGVLGIDFWKGGEGLGFAEGGGVLEDQIDWLMDDISLAMDMLMDPSDPRSLPSLNSKWGDAMTEAKLFATNLKDVFAAIAGAVKSASEALKTGLDATAMGKLTTSLATAAAAAGTLAQVPAGGAGNEVALGANPMAGGPQGAAGAPGGRVHRFRFEFEGEAIGEITARLEDLEAADHDFYITMAMDGGKS